MAGAFRASLPLFSRGGFLVPATAKERDIVERFLRSLGHSQFRLTNPNLGLQLDTGFDVFVELDGRQLGIQVTGTSPGQKGSNL